MNASATSDLFGQARVRREDGRFVSGRAQYSADVRPEGLVQVAFVRSPVASARRLAVDVTEARTAPGVVGAFTADDLGLRDIPDSAGRGRPEAFGMTRPPLARDRLRYVGEPLAAVVAEDSYTAADALESVGVDFEEIPGVVKASDALQDSTLVFGAAGTNVVHRASTRDDGHVPDLSRWPVRISVELENQRLAPTPLEPITVVAAPGDDGRLTVWCGHQAPHRLKNQLSMLLGIDAGSIRVVVPDVGGAFGMKAMLYPEYPVVAKLALELGRPVMWQQTRYEHFISGTHGRAMRHRVELAGDTDGRIHAGTVDILAELGAYPHNGSGVPLFSQFMSPGAYAIDDFLATTTMVVTNKAPMGSYRGAGRPEAAFAIERAIDVFAREVAMDPAEVRRRNFVRAAQMPFESPTGALYDGGDYEQAMTQALELAGVDEVRAKQETRRQEGGNPIGLGIGAFVERAGGGPTSTEYGRVEVDGGRVLVRTGSSAAGQGHETMFSQLAASVLRVDPDDVVVFEGDTDEVASGTGSFASRSAQIGGSTVYLCAERVLDLGRELAAELLDVPAEDLEQLEGGALASVKDPEQSVSLAEIAAYATNTGRELAAEDSWTPGAQTFPYGVCVAVVEVDRETGRIVLDKIVAVDDCGRVVNPLIVEGQVHGSLLQGVAQALFEGFEYDDDGQPLTANLGDYPAPTAPDAPEFTTGRMVTPAPSNPLGVKGSGESGCIGAPPAVVNAVLDALSPYGVKDLQMPLSPQRVWRALHPETKA